MKKKNYVTHTHNKKNEKKKICDTHTIKKMKKKSMWHTHNKKNEKKKVCDTHTIKKMKNKKYVTHTQ